MRRPTLDTFTRAYVTAALWLLDEDPGSGEWSEHGRYTIANIHVETLTRMAQDCHRFRLTNREDLDSSELTDSRAGQNFWLNRNGHGSGFWDEGEDPCFRRLSDACKSYGPYDLYFADNGRIHGYPG